MQYMHTLYDLQLERYPHLQRQLYRTNRFEISQHTYALLTFKKLNYQKKYAPNRSLILSRSLFFITFQDREEHHYHKKMYSNPQDLECLKTVGRVR